MFEIPLGTFKTDGVTVAYPPQLAVVQGTAITATSAATANTVCNIARNSRFVVIQSSCNLPVVITLGPTQATAVPVFQVEAGASISLDGDAGGLRFMAKTFIGAYNATGTPASGTLRVTFL